MHRVTEKAYGSLPRGPDRTPLPAGPPCCIIFIGKRLSLIEGGFIHARTEEGIEEVGREEESPRAQAPGRQEDREEPGTPGATEGSAFPAERHRSPEPAHGLHDAPSRRREALLHGPPRVPQIRSGSADELPLRPDRPFVQRGVHAARARAGRAESGKGADALLHGEGRGPR